MADIITQDMVGKTIEEVMTEKKPVIEVCPYCAEGKKYGKKMTIEEAKVSIGKSKEVK